MSYIGNTSTTQAFSPVVDYASGNGSTTAFTLSRPVASVAQVQVTIDNVPQNPTSAYTVSSNTITFTSAPLSGTNNIYVYYTSPITQVIAPGQGTVTATSMASSTGTGAGVFQTSPTITTPIISSLSSASATALTLQSAGTTAVYVDTSQKVGIGTTSPSYKLDVSLASSTSDIVARFNSPSYDELDFYVGSSKAYIGTASGTPLAFQTNSTERMRIDSSGNLLVGTTSALSQTGRATFVGTGNAVVTQVANGNTAYQSTNTSGTSLYYGAIWGNNGNSFSTCGTIAISGTSTAYNTSSDYRLKKDIAPMTGSLAKVALLKPVTYKWKSDGTDGEGFIAHELAEVCPQAVSGEKDALKEDGSIMPQGIDTSFLVATLTSALQETKALIDTQAETINALTARIEALENR